MESEITPGAVQSAVGVGQIGVQVIAQDRGDRRLTTTLPGLRGNLAHDLIPSALHADHARREIHVVAEKGGKLAAAQARVDRGGPHGGILRAVELGEHRLDRRGPRPGRSNVAGPPSFRVSAEQAAHRSVRSAALSWGRRPIRRTSRTPAASTSSRSSAALASMCQRGLVLAASSRETKRGEHGRR